MALVVTHMATSHSSVNTAVCRSLQLRPDIHSAFLSGRVQHDPTKTNIITPTPTLLTFSRSHVLTFSRSHVLTFLHSYTLTFLHSYILTLLHSYTLTFLHSYTLTLLHSYTLTFLHLKVPLKYMLIHQIRYRYLKRFLLFHRFLCRKNSMLIPGPRTSRNAIVDIPMQHRLQ